MILIVDASVAVMWFVPEPSSEAAAALLDSADELVAPDYVRIEVASALLKALRRGAIDRADADEALAVLSEGAVRTLPAAERCAEALAIAREHGGSLYDALYVAVARELEGRVITQDSRLAEVARSAGVEAIMLGDAPG